MPHAQISHLAKKAMISIADHFAAEGLIEPLRSVPDSRNAWANLGQSLGVCALQVSERDTQWTHKTREVGAFYNTWSVDGFMSEARQPAELGWGTHEKALPADGRRHPSGCGAAIYLERPGAATRVMSWTPKGGPHLGFLITHNEAISIADYFTLTDGDSGDVIWRPTVYYAYRPCDSAVLALEELRVNNWNKDFFDTKQVVVDEIVDGIDELGILVMGTLPALSAEAAPKHYSFWFGSELEDKVARKLVEHNSATTLQVRYDELRQYLDSWGALLGYRSCACGCCVGNKESQKRNS